MRLAQAMGRPALATDPRYSSHAARGDSQRELDELIEAWSSMLPTREVLTIMSEHGVPAGLIYRAPDMLEDPHFLARQAIVTVPHPDFGELKMQNVAPKLSETPGAVRSPSPALGEHNEQIYLRILGMSRERLDDLRSRNIV
jgi:formyl-CoA transferase